MTDREFTQAPWGYGPSGRVMADSYSQPFNVFEVGQPNLICECFGDVLGGEQVAKSNARLIAAAPELLAALQEVMSEWREGYGLRCEERVRAAIAKATGET